MNNINIRDAQEIDLPAILDIYNEVILNTTAVYSELPHTLEMRKDWYQERISNNFPVFVAVVGSEIAGFCSFGHFRAWPCYRYTTELSIYVKATHRGKGISKLMLRLLIDAAREKNVHALLAGISADNEISIKLHQSFGFAEVAHFKEVGYKFNRWLDLKFLELILTSPEAI
ncbi:GNAT family N-acetyltransferase [Mucilaginibacter sp. BJC16-A38]|uniref:GNAT family N-acetyltransferase n=1 Tax=Mucilaginibacter phenanthrenivorans TaxID=1234842 RepID=UPI002157CB00|nr:GNAT family N-acetyltransferase [Mucilaginibacter phenanthrenivorans]MCR8556093.1 GNAT family N-acetyltransferase [Mucilaginibacter phenanthrenivorans]